MGILLVNGCALRLVSGIKMTYTTAQEEGGGKGAEGWPVLAGHSDITCTRVQVERAIFGTVGSSAVSEQPSSSATCPHEWLCKTSTASTKHIIK